MFQFILLFSVLRSLYTAGVVMFTRSLVLYKRKGIRVNVLCPEVSQVDMCHLYFSQLSPYFPLLCS